MADDIEDVLNEARAQVASESSIENEDPLDDSAITDEDLRLLNMSRNKLRAEFKRKIESGKRRGRQEAMQDMNAQGMPMQDAQAPAPMQPAPQPAMQQPAPQMQQGMTPEQIRQMVAEEAQRAQQLQQQQYQQQIFDKASQEFVSQVLAADAEYPGLSDKVAKLGLDTLGAKALIFGVVNSGNVAGVMKELAENPRKYNELEIMFERSPQAAKDQLQSLVNSINTNQAAAKSATKIDEPLSRIRSSISANSSDNGERRSIGDWEKFLDQRR